MKLTLASTSKFKNQIFDIVGLNHYQVDSNFIEKSDNYNDVYQYVKDLSYGKANNVRELIDSGIIVGLDTVVVANNKILEKPKDIEEARKILKECSNNKTSVITGITLINKENNEIICDTCETQVFIREIPNKDIDYYINNEPNILYASGFIIETIISNFIEKIDGSYYNILGSPVETIYKHINSWGYNLIDLEKEK